MRNYVQRLLGDRYEVRAVPDGTAALAAAREEAPDLVLSDVIMPGLDGFGLLRELRKDERTRTVKAQLSHDHELIHPPVQEFWDAAVGGTS